MASQSRGRRKRAGGRTGTMANARSEQALNRRLAAAISAAAISLAVSLWTTPAAAQALPVPVDDVFKAWDKTKHDGRETRASTRI